MEKVFSCEVIVILRSLEKIGLALLHKHGFKSRMVGSYLGNHHVLVGEGRGKLPPVVFIHGIGASAVGFVSVLNMALNDYRRVIAIDLIGHGFSDSPKNDVSYLDVFKAGAEALSRIISEPCDFVGNSLGGALSLYMAREHPARVRGLSLWSPAGAPFSVTELTDLRRDFTPTRYADGVRFLKSVYASPSPAIYLVAADICKTYQLPFIKQIFASLVPDQDDLGDFLPTLTIPVQLVWGKREKIFPHSGLIYFRNKLPKHTIILEPEHMGHCPQMEHPREIYALLLDFSTHIASRNARV